MKISYSWLKEYISVDLTAEQTAEVLTFAGLEVEDTEKTESVKGGLDKYVIGKVLTCEAHPNSDHLHITTVDVGMQESLHIVCGAPNVAAGQYVVVATIGAKVYDGEECFEIKKSKLRGEVSEGMICSEKELQLSDNHDGIMVLNDEPKPGTAAKEYFNIKDDYVLEIGLTANRSDAASHLGVCRDLAAALNAKEGKKYTVNIPDVSQFAVDETTDNIQVNIDQSLCGRYSGLCIRNVKVAESPKWLKEHLSAIGIRPVNNIVDITNFVLMECGQPLHAFDLDKITTKTVNVRTLAQGTEFVTLDGVKRKLNGKEAMVCNGDEPMCLGGIFGGKDSGITEKTENIFIESAYFNPVVIRKAAKYHQISTDASFRYERGADANITLYALKRAALLIKQLCQATITSNIIDVYPSKVEKKCIDLEFDYLDKLTGKKIDRQVIKTILESLDIELPVFNEQGLQALIPTCKVDVTRPCDLAEEILRIYGYNNIEFAQNVKSSLSYTPKPDKEKIQNIITSYLADNGFNETMTNSLTPSSYYKDNKDFEYGNCVKLFNPLSADLDVMRQTLLYGSLEVVAFNLNRKLSNIKIFEFGNCYQQNPKADKEASVDKRFLQQKHLSIAVSGKMSGDSWQKKAEDVTFFFLKNIVFNVLKRLRTDTDQLLQEPVEASYFSSGLKLVNKESKKTLAVLGQVSAKTKAAFDIKPDVFFADIYWENVVKQIPSKDIKYQTISKFPAVRRDLALVVDKDVTFETIEKIIKDCDRKLIRSVNLFDDYQGLKEAGKKQYAVSVTLQDEQKTLTDKQIEATVNKIMKTLTNKVDAKLR
ncbi:MAG: phenylalanine--tRNA ligase subunit beta [Bacteroidales bacterium]|nr:phenylalanine--tRNA ligase subunit beta [Bacteroidales bacterium]